MPLSLESESHVAQRDIIVIGASAGGVSALREIAKGLPQDLPAAVFVVLHVGAFASNLPRILNARGGLPARHPEDGERIERGNIYVAPPDRHLLLDGERIRLVRGPKENFSRPAIGPLFRSAAVAFGPRVIAVILTGYLNDGAAGLRAVKRRGGIAVVQDPEDALCPDMPRNAQEYARVDHTLPLAQIAPTLEQLTMTPIKPDDNTPVPEKLAIESAIALSGESSIEDMDKLGIPSPLSCPHCGGPVWRIDDGDLTRFRCHTGHAFTSETLATAQHEECENALWAAVRSLEQQAHLSRLVAKRARDQGKDTIAQSHEAEAEASAQHVNALRDILRAGEPPSE